MQDNHATHIVCAVAAALAITTLTAPSAVRAETVVVSATPSVVYSGVLAPGGQAYHVAATGIVELAGLDGSYQADANGTITFAPPSGSGAYIYFFDQPPVGPPTIGSFKDIDPGSAPNSAAILGAPYGALGAGFSTTLTPTSYTVDFPEGFAVVGTEGTISAPPGGGYLMFSVNDVATSGFGNRSDNSRSFVVNFDAVPEPATVALFCVGLAGLGVASRRRGRRNAVAAGNDEKQRGPMSPNGK